MNPSHKLSSAVDDSAYANAVSKAVSFCVDTAIANAISHANTIVQPKSIIKKTSGCTTAMPSQTAAVDADYGRGIHLLYAFSGPRYKRKGFVEYCSRLGATIDTFDTVDDKVAGDLANDEVWSPLDTSLKNKVYDGGLFSPPCSTISGVRNNYDGGPRPLRTPEGPELYGKRNLWPNEQEEVRLANLLYARTADAAQRFLDMGPVTFRDGTKLWLPWLIEQPLRKSGMPHSFNMSWLKRLLEHEAVEDEDVVQCHDEARTQKPSTFRATFRTGMAPKCLHEPQWWRMPWSGQWHWSPHPTLGGTQWMIPAEDWHSGMLEPREPSGPYISKSAAAYPPAMNRRLAVLMIFKAKLYKRRMLEISSSHSLKVSAQQNSMSDCHDRRRDDAGVTDLDIQHSAPLRGPNTVTRSPKEEEDRLAIGGMRHPRFSVDKLSRHKAVGADIRSLIDKFLDNMPGTQQACLQAIGSETHSGPSDADVDSFRRILGKYLGCTDLSAVDNEDCVTTLRPQIFEYWAKAAKDPAVVLGKWLTSGAPGGINQFPPDDGVFPKAADPSTPCDSLEFLHSDPETFVNYSGVEENDDVWKQLKAFVDARQLLSFDTYEEVCNYLKSKPILSKFGVISKWKDGAWKHRIIMDSNRSGVTGNSRRTHRLILPRATDAVSDALGLSMNLPPGHSLEQFILDFVDAFWIVPNAKAERKFFVGKVRNKYLVYRCTAQGSRGAPFSWGYKVAFTSRATQSLFCPYTELRLQTYVDDPHAILRGDGPQRDRMIASIVLLWRAMGYELSFKKGKRGCENVWIGNQYKLTETEVSVSVRAERLQDIEEITDSMAATNVTPIAALKSYTGKVASVASVVPSWRPFVHDLWGVIYSDDSPSQSSNAPQNCVWTAQLMHVLIWVKAFLTGAQGSVLRVFNFNTYVGLGSDIRIQIDASPWGLGGVLAVNHVLRSWFACPITELDVAMFGRETASCEGQQLWEALCMLVALRLWKPWWLRDRAVLTLKSDSTSSLSLLQHLRSKSAQLNIIARELALDLGDCSFKPSLITHTPGVANVVPDILSRKYQPDKNFCLPACLASVPEAVPPTREEGYYKAIAYIKSVRLVRRKADAEDGALQ